MSSEELTRIASAFARLGVTKVRLTGGEPLLRRDLPELVAAIAGIPGIEDVALTTNGSLLARRAAALRAAGLTRVTVSLDSLDPAVFARMADTPVPLSDVLAGIGAASAAGLGPVKLNAVLRRGVNEDGLPALVDFARAGGHVLRFIEYMDVGTTNGWLGADVVPAAEIVECVDALHPLESLPSGRPDETARRWRYRDGGGEIGVIASVTAPFCTDCSRARVTAAGELFTCLFGSKGTDLRAVVRSGASDEELVDVLRGVWSNRVDRYSQLRGRGMAPKSRAEMSYLGG